MIGACYTGEAGWGSGSQFCDQFLTHVVGQIGAGDDFGPQIERRGGDERWIEAKILEIVTEEFPPPAVLCQATLSDAWGACFP